QFLRLLNVFLMSSRNIKRYFRNLAPFQRVCLFTTFSIIIVLIPPYSFSHSSAIILLNDASKVDYEEYCYISDRDRLRSSRRNPEFPTTHGPGLKQCFFIDLHLSIGSYYGGPPCGEFVFGLVCAGVLRRVVVKLFLGT